MRTRPTTVLVALAAAIGAVACGPTEEEQAASRAAAIEVVEGFGSRLKHVNLLIGDAETLTNDIRDTYGAYVTTLLLGEWLTYPASAPGRETSSPWPDRIEVRDVTPVGGTTFEITGDIVYVTAVDGEPVLRQPMRATVVRGPDDVWRISQWH